MTTYVFRDGQMVDREGNPMLTEAERQAPPARPTIRGDIQPYQSPIDGKWITSASERRYDLESNNCVPYEPEHSPTKGKIKNHAFAAKRGLQVSEEFR